MHNYNMLTTPSYSPYFLPNYLRHTYLLTYVYNIQTSYLLINDLPPIYPSTYLPRVTERSKDNCMDSKNLAICWWPTLLQYEFGDLTKVRKKETIFSCF